jgi:hypothetical protein
MLPWNRLTAIRHGHAASEGPRRARSPSAWASHRRSGRGRTRGSPSSTRASGRPRYAPRPPAGLAHHRTACQDKVGPRATAATGSTVSSSGTSGEMRAVSKWPISSLIPVFSHPQHRKGSSMRPQTMSCLITADILLTFFLRHFCFDIGGCGRSGGSRGARNDCFTNFGKHAVFGKTRFKHNRRPSDFFPQAARARSRGPARNGRSISSVPKVDRKSRAYRVSIFPWRKDLSYFATRAPDGRICRGRRLRFSSGRSCRNSNRLADRRRQSTILGPVQGFQDRRPHGFIFVGNRRGADRHRDRSLGQGSLPFRLCVQSPLQRDLACGAADVAEQRNGGAWRDPPRRGHDYA